MTTTDCLIDSVLVLLVLLQIRERTLTTKTLIRPLLIVGIAGMGSRFAFIFWITHGGAASIADFSVQHAITGSAWTVALLAMAVCEVVARSALMAARRQRLHGRRAFEFA